MHILSNTYQISISRIEEPLKSKDMQPFEYVFNPREYTTDEFHSAFSIKVETKNRTFSIGLIGSYYAQVDHCAVLDESKLTILMDDEVFVLDLEATSLILHRTIGDETYFAIYPVEGGYIIHGELTVLRLNRDYDQVWCFCGADIFVTQDNGLDAFKIDKNHILLEDWNGMKYTLNMSGNLIQ